MSEVTVVAETLPTTRTLLRTTVIAAAVAAMLVVGVVLPTEYGVDPTGVGRVLGLTQMGKLKQALMQEELALDAAATAAVTSSTASGTSPQTSSGPTLHRDSLTITLSPQEALEVKLAMTKGWYWKNPTNHEVQITVRAWGQFQELKKM